jgi:putative glutathione S-transferase
MGNQTFELDTEVTEDRFVRQASAFRDRITTAEAGRYHLYVAPACPWSHRAMIVRKLVGAEDAISLSWLHPYRDARGWAFQDGAFTDPLHGWAFLSEAYEATEPDFGGRVSVPVLWDKHEGRIVNNESADIVRMLDQVFGDGSLRPPDLADEIDALNRRIYAELQNAVYEAGFAGSQAAYEEAARRVFATLDWLEELLGERRYLAGDRITEADWRLFPTLVRFDPVYVDHFRCNLRRLADHPNLWGYTRELYQQPGIAETVAMGQIKRHYYTTHDSLEPSRIIPIGPQVDFTAPHGRGG